MSETPWPYDSPRRPPAVLRRAPRGLTTRWLLRPSGEPVEVVSLGVLAGALLKTPRTVRRWEEQGFLPETPFVTPVRGAAPRRVYTTEQVEGIVRIAKEEGLVGRKPFSLASTAFTERVLELHADLFGT